MSGQSHLAAIATEVEELIGAKMNDFFCWCDNNWGMKDSADVEMAKGPEWAEGWDAAIASISDAYECWSEEGQP